MKTFTIEYQREADVGETTITHTIQHLNNGWYRHLFTFTGIAGLKGNLIEVTGLNESKSYLGVAITKEDSQDPVIISLEEPREETPYTRTEGSNE